MATRRHRLVQRRKAVGYTQEQLAEQLGVERTTVIRWEAGDTQPQPWQWPNLADALKMAVEQLTDLLDGSLSREQDGAHQALSGINDVYATLTRDVALTGQTGTLLLDFFTQPPVVAGTLPTALAMVSPATLRTRIEEIDGIIADVATLAAVNSTRRIDQRVTDLRAALIPWQHSKPVRHLDDVLTAYRRGTSGSGNT
jgi:DNA-binding XRE family transcriptional regulator